MADNSSSIPPSSSSRIVTSDTSTQITPHQVSPSNSSETLNLLIKQAPANLKELQSAQTLEGKVIYSNPEAQEMRVRIDETEIILKTSIDLPHDTKILIKLYNQNNHLTANITVLEEGKKHSASETVTMEISKPLSNTNFPSIQAGNKLVSILIPNAKTEAIEEILQTISSINKNDISLTALDANNKLLIESLIFGTNSEEILSDLTKSKIDQLGKIIKTALDIKTADPKSIYSKLNNPYLQTNEQKPVKNLGVFISNSAELNEAGDEHINILTSSILTEPSIKASSPASTHAQSLLTAEELEFVQSLATTVELKHPQQAKKYILDILQIIPSKTELNKIAEIIKDSETVNDKQFHSIIKIGEQEGTTREGFPVIKTTILNAENLYGEKENEVFIVKQQVKINESDIILFKSIPSPDKEISNNVILAISENQEEEFIPSNSKTWGALEEFITTIKESYPQLSTNISNSIPAPNREFPATALFFLAAIKFGSVDGWLGTNTLQILKNSEKAKLADTLKDNFSRITNLYKESYIGEWKIISMPFTHENNIEQMKIYINKEFDENDNENKNQNRKIKSMRFVFNIELSKMGKMQIDGSLKKEEKLLNMTLRSAIKLHEIMRGEISSIYISTLEQMGMKGQITFASGTNELINIEKLAYEEKSHLSGILI